MKTGWDEISSSDIVRAVGGFQVNGDPSAKVDGLSIDSRTMKAGEIFWSIRGTKYDGHDFILKALDLGAAGVVSEESQWKGRPEIRNRVSEQYKDKCVILVDDTIKALGNYAGWWRNRSDVKIAAITGSAGKTTTKEMTAAILSIKWNILKNKGNFNNLIGLPLSLLSLKPEHERAVLEMGMSRAGEISRLTEITKPDLGLITNIGMAHLEGVGDIWGVARAKAEMVERMPNDSRIIINGDDDRLFKTVFNIRKDVTTFGLDKSRDIFADKIQSRGFEGSEFNVFHKKGTFHVKLKTPGVQDILNALAAAAICLGLEVPEEDIVSGLESFAGINGRFRVIKLTNDNILVDDTYNSNPLSLESALKSANMVGKDMKIIIALGDMLELGKTSVDAHIEAGRMVARLNPECFIAMGNYANEMMKGALSAGMNKSDVFFAGNHEDMTEKIRSSMTGRNFVLIKGSRGMELDKVVRSLTENFLNS